MSFSRILFARPLFLAKNFNLVRRCSSQNGFDLSDTAVQIYLKSLIYEHEKLAVLAKRTPEESKRLFEIKPIVSVLEQRINFYENIESLKELDKKQGEDKSMKAMIKEEAEIYLQRMGQVDRQLKAILLEPQLTDGGVLLEVTAGAGGQESMLFARELFDMYEAYSKYKDWATCIVSLERSDIGGIRKASMFVEGPGVPELLKMEAGVHRVQRIPTTEKGGRIHTSTVSVAVLPQPTDIEANIADRDIVIETKRASGAGGQHVNTTDSAVRITHTPTGTVVECQEGRSQIKNKEIAIQKLRTILLDKQRQEQESKMKSERKSQIGSSNRNEKIRTYNYPQDRVTDHREGGITIHNLEEFMEGDYLLEEMQNNILRKIKKRTFLEEINEFAKKLNIDLTDKSTLKLHV